MRNENVMFDLTNYFSGALVSLIISDYIWGNM